MGEYKLSDLNGTAAMPEEKRRGGVHISHGAAFILVLLAVCLAVLVGLVVHLVSPGQVVCKCETPAAATPPLRPEELRARCVELAGYGDREFCEACSKKTIATTANTTATIPTSPTTTTTTPAPIINYRLPTAVKPFHYVLELQPEIYGDNPSLFTFSGTVSIVINVTQATSNVTLHKKDLMINNDSLSLRSLDNQSDRGPSIVSTSYDEVREFYVLHLDNDLEPGRSYVVEMSFHAKMRTEWKGLYLSSYKADTNETIYLATTQFAASHARKAFPCFDEPALKATFDITLVRKTTTGRDYRTLANTEVVSNEIRGNYTADIFATTPVMSTYVLAFMVCDFDQLENTTSNITYRTLARPNALKHAGRAQKYGLDLFDWFEKTFDPDYPITKLDSIAIPDFYGPIQNWGIITYDEYLLYKEGVSTASQDRWIAEKISEGISYQWFGNIVSPKWWSWLWLNEALVNFWDVFVVGTVYPTRRSMEHFTVSLMHRVMVDDGVQTSHPMTNEVESNAEVERSFDPITDTKGACVVRMMQLVMGQDLFVRGLNRYLKRHQYSVAEHKDLFNALTEQSQAEGTPINMTEIFEPWVTQMNFPLVTVKVTGPGTINVRQERFLTNMSSNTTGDTAPFGYKWTIPITIASSRNSTNLNKVYSYNDFAWLASTEQEKDISDSVVPDPSQENSWVVVNGQQSGYYKVNYEERNWMALIKQLETDHTVFPPVTRAHIINDAWSLHQAGVLKFRIAIRTMNFLKNEVDYIPWLSWAQQSALFFPAIESSPYYSAYSEFIKVTANKTYNHYRMNIQADTVPLDVHQTHLGARYACRHGVQECVDDSLRLFREMMKDPVNNRINPEVVDVVPCTAVRYGGMPEWNFAYKQYRSENLLRRERFWFAAALACTTQPWLLQRMLDMSLDNTSFRSFDEYTITVTVSLNFVARDISWNFIKNNLLTLHIKYGERLVSDLIFLTTSRFNRGYLLNELKTFTNTTMVEGYELTFQYVIKLIHDKLDWLEKNGDEIKEWLTEEGFAEYLP